MCPGQIKETYSRFEASFTGGVQQYPRPAISEVLNPSPCSSREDERPIGMCRSFTLIRRS